MLKYTSDGQTLEWNGTEWVPVGSSGTSGNGAFGYSGYSGVSGFSGITPPTPSLQSVTTIGNTSTNGIQLNNGASLNLAFTTSAVSEQNAITETINTVNPSVLDTWSISLYRSAKYLIQIVQGSDSQISEVIMLYDGTTSKVSEFAILTSASSLASFDGDVNSGNARLIVEMTASTSATIKMERVLITA